MEQETERSLKEISIAVETILRKVNSKYKKIRHTPKKIAVEGLSEDELKEIEKLEAVKRREGYTERVRERDTLIIKLCNKHHISIKHIMTIGGFHLDSTLLN